MAANSKYACSCGRTFSFESVLMRHCKQTGHEPASGPVEEQPRPVMASVQAAAEAAKQQAAAAPPPAPPPPAPAAPAPAPAAPPPAPEPPAAAAPAPAPEPAPAAPPPPKPAPKPAAAPAPAPAPPPPPAPAPVAEAPAVEEPAVEAPIAGEGPAPGEDPLIYEAALRVLMAKQSAWQDAVPPPPPLKVRLAQLFRPQLEQLDSALNKGSSAVHTGRKKTAPYLSVILSVPIGLVLIWAGYRLAKAMLTLP